MTRRRFWIILGVLAAAALVWWYLHSTCPACQERAGRLRRRLGAMLLWGNNH